MRLVWDSANKKAPIRPVDQWETSTGYKPHCNNPCPRRWWEQTEVELKINYFQCLTLLQTPWEVPASCIYLNCKTMWNFHLAMDRGWTDIRTCWASNDNENTVTHLLRWHSSGCWGCRMTSPHWPRTGMYQRRCGPTPAPPGCGVWHKDKNKLPAFPVLTNFVRNISTLTHDSYVIS